MKLERLIQMATLFVFFAVTANSPVAQETEDIQAEQGNQELSLETRDEKFAYSMGVQIGVQIVQQIENLGYLLSGQHVAQGIADILTLQELKLNEEEIQAVITEVETERRENELAKLDRMQKAGAEYRESYAQKKGVIKDENGLLYRVIEKGDGKQPTLEDSVTVHYRGTLIDGTEFDSSYSRNSPTTFGLNGIIAGWQQALQKMKAGAKWEVVIPPELGYGERGAPPNIPPFATLVFEIELLNIN